ncbi:MAG: type II secretion system F family protein [Candidatus Dormibacteraeota bacterium]|nr:type II secretion system F family protein [Candidatus Dormibacteraeota bacterium]
MNFYLIVGLAVAAGAFLFFFGFDKTNKQQVVTARDQLGPKLTVRDRIDAMFQANEQWSAAAATAKPGKLSLAEQISRADLKLRTSEWMMVRFGSAALFGLIGVARFGFGAFGVQALVLAVLGYFIPQFYLGFRQRKRLKAFNNQLGDTLVLMANALKTGYSLAQALDVVANKASPPMNQEFDRVVKEVNLGAGIEESLGRMVRRTESSDLDMVATAIAINRKIGGNLSEILETISETIRERVRIKGEMSSMTAQARGSGYMITALPIVLGVFMYFVTPQYFAPMLGNPIGIGMLIGAGIFMGLGQLIMGKIATVDV